MLSRSKPGLRSVALFRHFSLACPLFKPCIKEINDLILTDWQEVLWSSQAILC